MLLYTYKALNDHAPPYMCKIVTKYELRRQLRSSGKWMVIVPKIRTNRYGARSFLYALVMFWNDLCGDRLTVADYISVFKGRLKTHLFNKYFS